MLSVNTASSSRSKVTSRWTRWMSSQSHSGMALGDPNRWCDCVPRGRRYSLRIKLNRPKLSRATDRGRPDHRVVSLASVKPTASTLRVEERTEAGRAAAPLAVDFGPFARRCRNVRYLREAATRRLGFGAKARLHVSVLAPGRLALSTRSPSTLFRSFLLW
jgi:hypothetical protein